MSPSSALHRKMRPVAAFVALGERGLRAIDDHLDTLQHRDEIEDVHALRVAVRHLRAVIWAFGPVLPSPVRVRWTQALHDVADAASAVRDWDVFIAETLTPALTLQPGDPVLTALVETAQARRTASHQAMLPRLSHCRELPLPTLSRDLGHLADWESGESADRMGTFAPGRIRQARRRVRKLARIARDGQTEHVHRYRIGNKRLRYAIEALADVLPRRYRKRLRKKLIARQTELGAIIDGAVARRLICECLQG